MFANVSPTCSPCGHVMQPVGERTLWERQIGGAAASFWFGREYECVSCRTRVVLADSRPVTPGSVGYEVTAATVEPLQTIPAKRVIWAEHLPADVRRDTCRMGGAMPLSQRQQAARIVDDFWSTDGADPMAALEAIARVLGVDVEAGIRERAAAVLAEVNDPSLHTWSGPVPSVVRAHDGSPLSPLPSLTEVD
jgi:hypothetical protein